MTTAPDPDPEPPPLWWTLGLIGAAALILAFWQWLPWLAEAFR